MTTSKPVKLTKPQLNMIERLKNAPKQRIKTSNKRELSTLQALYKKGLAFPLYLPTKGYPTGMYALKNKMNRY